MWHVVTAAVLLLAGCGTATGTSGGQPEDDLSGTWELVSGRGPDGELSVVDGYPVTLTVEGDQFGGTSACNHYGARLERTGDRVRVTEISGTAMGCEPDVMALERAYLSALEAVERIDRDGEALVLTGPTAELRFRAVPPVPTAALVDTTWVLESLVDGATASSPVGDPATLRLAADGTLTGSTGCRELRGVYVESGAEIVATNLAADGDCPQSGARQDDHVVAVIGDGFRAEVRGDRLTLTSQGGRGLVYRSE